VWFGKKYFIWKGKALHQSVDMIAKEIDRSLRLGLKDNDIFAKVVHQIKYARIALMEIEAVCQSEDPVEILTCEAGLLQAGATDPLCLNTTFVPHYPKWIPEAAVHLYEQSLRKASRKTRSSGKTAQKGLGARKVSSPKPKSQKQPLNAPSKVATKNGTSVKKLISPKGTKSNAKK
jgi:hypothetical protein